MNESRLPLGICKQAIMKLESAMNDINDIACDEDVDQVDQDDFKMMNSYLSNIISSITVKVMNEMGEDEFIAEQIDMDPIDEFPESDILDEKI